MGDNFNISDVRDSEVLPNVVDVAVSGVVGGREVSGSVSFDRGGARRAAANLGSFPGWISGELEEAVRIARAANPSFSVQAVFDTLEHAVQSELALA